MVSINSNTDIEDHRIATIIFKNLLIFGFKKIERKIINEGIINITEKMSNKPGVKGPTGVWRFLDISIDDGVIPSKKSA